VRQVYVHSCCRLCAGSSCTPAGSASSPCSMQNMFAQTLHQLWGLLHVASDDLLLKVANVVCITLVMPTTQGAFACQKAAASHAFLDVLLLGLTGGEHVMVHPQWFCQVVRIGRVQCGCVMTLSLGACRLLPAPVPVPLETRGGCLFGNTGSRLVVLAHVTHFLLAECAHDRLAIKTCCGIANNVSQAAAAMRADPCLSL
jgi:hypothetical protein